MDWLALPPMAALRAFAAYAETGNVSRAGEALNVSHAAISQQLRALEAHMGLSLLDRSGRQAELTPEGAQLAAALREGFEAISQVCGELTGREAARPLIVSATPSMASAWLLPRLADFRAKHPGIDLMLDASAELREIGPGGTDVALRYGSGTWPGLEAQLLVRSPVVVVAAPSLLEALPEGGPAALADYPWLQEIGTTEASEFLRRHGALPGPEAGSGVMSMPGNLMLEAARAGQGLAPLALVSVQADIAAGRLVEIFRDRAEKGYWIVHRPGVQRPALKLFTAWLKRQADET